MTHDEQFEMTENMERYGGSFVKALAECFRRADEGNTQKLLSAFPEIVERYLEMGRAKKKEKDDD